MTRLIIISLFLMIQFSVWGQKQKKFHPELFSRETVKKARELEEKHWTDFYGAAAEPFKEGKINDAALLFYLGQLRYRYYVASHTKEETVADRTAFASLHRVFGADINYELGEDIDNYIKILEAVIEWAEANDYKFYSKKKDPDKYEEILNGLKELRQHFIDNKDSIIEERE